MLLCCVCSIAHVDENFTIRLKSIAARQCFSSKYVFLIFMNHKSVLHNRVGYTCARKRSIEIRRRINEHLLTGKRLQLPYQFLRLIFSCDKIIINI